MVWGVDMESFARGWRGRSFFHRSNTRSAEEKIYSFSLLVGWLCRTCLGCVGVGLWWSEARGVGLFFTVVTLDLQKKCLIPLVFVGWVVLDRCVYPFLGCGNEKA
jgi:hypothetical protein